MSIKGGRQSGRDLSDIRDDHVARYRFATQIFKGYNHPYTSVIDLGCGVGYGGLMMAREGLNVCRVDKSEEALSEAETYWPHENIDGSLQVDLDGSDIASIIGEMVKPFGATAFEVIEHLASPDRFLKSVSDLGVKCIVGSVPNELVVPHDPKRNSYHYRHYSPSELHDLVQGAGFMVAFMGGQLTKRGKGSDVQPRRASDCRTLVFVGAR